MDLEGEGITEAAEGVPLPAPFDILGPPEIAIGSGHRGALNNVPAIEKRAAVKVGHTRPHR